MAFDPLSWYLGIPLVSRLYLTLSFLTTAACALDLVSPFALYFNWKLVVRGEVWRLLSNFFFFGMFNLDFLFHMYFLLRYCRLLEEGTEFRGKTADFVTMVVFGAVLMSVIAPHTKVQFLGSSLTFMMVYVWGQMRSNSGQRMMLLGILPFTAPYLPWVLLSFSLLLGHSAMVDVIGIAVGHSYFYLKFVLPEIAEIRGWRCRQFLITPGLLHYIFGTSDAARGITGGVELEPFLHVVPPAAAAAAPAPAAAAAAPVAAAAPAPAAAVAGGGGAGGGADGGGGHPAVVREDPAIVRTAAEEAVAAQEIVAARALVQALPGTLAEASAAVAAAAAAATDVSDAPPASRAELRNRRLQAFAARSDRAEHGEEVVTAGGE
jgi:Derlin-2/3